MNITIEELLEILESNKVRTIAGYNGSCERVIQHDELIKALKDLKKRKAPEPAYPQGHFQCLACGGLHPGSGNLPCPRMSPASGGRS